MKTAKKEQKTVGQKIAVLIEEHYQVLEAWYPYLRLREEGIEAVFVGTEKKGFKSKEGYPAEAEAAIREVRAGDFDGVIIPGGYAPDILRRSKDMVGFVRELHQEEKLVAAICHGGWLLSSAEILKGRKVTGFISIKDDLTHAGADYRNEEVVIDGNLVTSRKPEDLPAFCKAILAFLKSKQK